MNKSVLIITANPAVHPIQGYPVGFWASEVFHPLHVFNESGISWTLASPSGGPVVMDALSNPHDPYSSWDTLSRKYVDDPEYAALLENTPPVSSLDLDAYDAILVAGGQSPMFTFGEATDLHEAFLYFYEKQRISAALCHGVALLNFLEVDGKPLVEGKQITGFSNEEEEQANTAAGHVVMPWRIEDALMGKGADFVKGDAWSSFVAQDGHLITGQQNMSGEATARRIVELL